MSAAVAVGAVKLFQAINLGLELVTAGQLVIAKIAEAQAKRDAEGKPLTDADVLDLMKQGDIKAAMERAQIVAAKAAQESS